MRGEDVDEGITLGEVGRSLKNLEGSVQKVYDRLDLLTAQFVPREVLDLKMAVVDEHERDLREHTTRLDAIAKDMVSKRVIVGALTVIALLAGAIAAVVSAIMHA